jgi:membrane protein
VHFSVGVARADVLFGSFALLPLLFAWIYVFWAIVLLGAEIAFAHQNFALYRQEVRSAPRRRPSARRSRSRSRSTWRAASAPASPRRTRSARRRAPGARAHGARGGGAARRRGAPLDARRRDPGARLPARAPAESITASDVLAAVRGRRKRRSRSGAAPPVFVDGLLDDIDSAAHKGAGERTLAELVPQLGPPTAPIDPPATRG